jgi:ribosome-associated protein
VSSAIHLRFDINASSLPDFYKQRLLALKDRRISKEGVIIIKAQKFRTREKNHNDALLRLQELIRGVAVVQKSRTATRPTKASRKRRLDSKTRRGRTKELRGKVSD